MRRLFSKYKKSTETKYIELPSPPLDVSYKELIYKTNRGYLAKKIGQYLGLESLEWDKLFYSSLKNVSFSQVNFENENELILYLSQQMLEWNKRNEDIQKKIMDLDIHIKIQNAMMKVYEVHRRDLFLQSTLAMEHEKIHLSEEKQNEWRIYRDVMFAATQGQFMLISEREATAYLTGNILCNGTIKERSDIPKTRNSVQKVLEKKGLANAKMMSWLLALSEAITNTIKHAEEGQLILIENDEQNELLFVIQDKGPGFPLEDLPKKILLSGYSTKRSMGQGFTIMRKMAKQILLYTSPKGSTLILIFDLGTRKSEEILSSVSILKK
ncbi:ATP-binding protein [Bacillus dakarensis]|uniref:ATP-binding protein n=1 Tax=Robertmurraya dakarensis TaxID=1926278 RepID=UPI000980C394|nr:ATP-binding protein [Bacillus dakarensis]